MRNERQIVLERKRDLADRLRSAAKQIDDSQADRFPEGLQLLRAVIRIESIVQRRILRFARLRCLSRWLDCTRPRDEAATRSGRGPVRSVGY
jgi:hypothetical protein